MDREFQSWISDWPVIQRITLNWFVLLLKTLRTGITQGLRTGQFATSAKSTTEKRLGI